MLYGAEDLDGAYKNIMDISTILGVTEKGEIIVDGMKKKVESVENKVKSLDKPKIYYVVDFGKADFTAGGDTFIGKMIEKQVEIILLRIQRDGIILLKNS